MLDKRVNLQNGRKVGGFLTTLILCLSLSVGTFITVVSAQSFGAADVAKTITIADSEVSYGDVVLYDVETNLYRISQAENDPRFFGVVVEDPTLVLETENNIAPVVQAGLVPVNVTLENGEIESGSPLTTSSVAGKATLAVAGQVHIFGFAAEPLSEEEAVLVDDGVLMGTVLVEVGGERLRAYILSQESSVTPTIDEEGVSEEVQTQVGTDYLIRLGFASLVALAAIFLIFFVFISSIRQGVISVGRNPRAKSAIRSMVILNVVLAVVVVSAAIFFAISLLVVGD